MIDLSILDRTKDEIRTLGQTRGPIVVGPWLSEVGFELLYWIPFLRWAISYGGWSRDDLHIVSRGGCRSWYADISSQYSDVLDLFTPREFRRLNDARIDGQASRYASVGLRAFSRSPKQLEVSDFDREILERLGLSVARLFHPSAMYQYFRAFWRRQAPGIYTRSTTVRRLPRPARLAGLPESYVAMKFYTSSSVTDTPRHRQLIAEMVSAQAETADVVLLETGAVVDDHTDLKFDAHPRIHRVPVTPATNLETQTAIVAHASRFVGTYGGFAYLAPFLGVPTLALYGHQNFRRDHRDVMAMIARADLKVPFALEHLKQGRQLLTKGGRRAA